jgi:hypothetical protein
MSSIRFTSFDDFYRDPDAVRALALGGTFTREKGAYTGTINANHSLERAPVMRRIADLVGCRIEYAQAYQGSFRSLTAAEFQAKTKHVHIDRMGLAGVLCLNPSYDAGCTSFFRHRETGLTGVLDKVAFLGACAAHRVTPRRLLARLDKDGSDMSAWDRVGAVRYRYNRLIVFDSNLFHVASPGFGDHIDNAKLTQNFRFYPYERLYLWRRLALEASSRMDGQSPS